MSFSSGCASGIIWPQWVDRSHGCNQWLQSMVTVVATKWLQSGCNDGSGIVGILVHERRRGFVVSALKQRQCSILHAQIDLSSRSAPVAAIQDGAHGAPNITGIAYQY
jgi:hypothetical protein